MAELGSTGIDDSTLQLPASRSQPTRVAVIPIPSILDVRRAAKIGRGRGERQRHPHARSVNVFEVMAEASTRCSAVVAQEEFRISWPGHDISAGITHTVEMTDIFELIQCIIDSFRLDRRRILESLDNISFRSRRLDGTTMLRQNHISTNERFLFVDQRQHVLAAWRSRPTFADLAFAA